MRIILAAFMAIALPSVAAVAGGEDHNNQVVPPNEDSDLILTPNVLAPDRFDPPPQHPSPVDQQRALEYRTQVQRQLKDLQHDQDLGRLGPLGQRRLLDTRTESGRMDQVTGPRPVGAAPFGSPLLPSMLPSLSH